VTGAVSRGKGWRAALRRGAGMLRRADHKAAAMLSMD
jgi:hypothetical protein